MYHVQFGLAFLTGFRLGLIRTKLVESSQFGVLKMDSAVAAISIHKSVLLCAYSVLRSLY
jgi:hypothetical protein